MVYSDSNKGSELNFKSSQGSAIVRMNTNNNTFEINTVKGGNSDLSLITGTGDIYIPAGSISLGGTLANGDIGSFPLLHGYNGEGQGNFDFFRGHINLKSDDDRLRIGVGADLDLYHNGTDSYIENDTGKLIIKNDAQSVITLQHGSELYMECKPDAGVELY